MTGNSRSCLIDTNVLIRIARKDDAEHLMVRDYVLEAIVNGFSIFHCSQNVVEFWNVVTRTKTLNGNAHTIEQAVALLNDAGVFSTLLPDHVDVQAEWQRLVIRNSVIGKAVFDARLVATMNVHGITRILTRNAIDFRPYPHLQVFDPKLGVPVS